MRIHVLMMAFLVATSLACDTKKKDITTLKVENDALRRRLAVLENQLAAIAESVGRFDDLNEALYRNDDGDVVVDGANLRIVNGSGQTYITGNGKGNVIIGYDDRRDGESVASMQEKRTGSHNLVVGRDHAYPGSGNVIFGAGNTADADGSSLLGGRNNTVRRTSGFYPDGLVVVGGSGNEANGMNTVVVGGYKGKADGRDNVLLGGYAQSVSGPGQNRIEPKPCETGDCRWPE